MTTFVNYVWMREDLEASHAIPTYLFHQLQQNAARYPEAEFGLWVESIAAYKDYEVPPNVTPYELNSIPAFSDVPVLSFKTVDYIWAKVDIARLLVVQHVLKSQPDCSAAVYADFDIEDISLETEGYKKRLETYGVAFGGTYSTIDGKKMTYNYSFENGYLAFTPATFDLLDHIVKAVCRIAAGYEEDRLIEKSAVYESMSRALHQWPDKEHDKKWPFSKFWRKDIASLPVQHFSDWRGNTHLVAEAATKPPPRLRKATEFVAIL